MAKGVRFSLTATNNTKAAFAGVQKDIQRTQGAQRSWSKGLNANRRAVQQFGFQMSDFAIQIAGGQSAMLAFTQQGGQMLQFFGPAGAIMAAFLAIFGSLAIAFTRSGKALSDLTPILGVLQEDFRAIGRVLGYVKELMIDFANIVVNNMDRILITAGLVAGLFVGRWVVAFVAARIATFSLAGALLFLRGALIRTGIGVLIVAAGEMVYQFTKLVRGAGSFGEAMRLLAAVAVEVWDRIGEGAHVMWLRITAAWDGLKGSIYVTLQGVLDQVGWVVNRIIGSFVGAYEAVVAVWDSLPAAFRRIGALAMNALIEKLQGGLTAVVGMINTVFEAVSLPTIPAPDFSAWKAEVGEAVDIAGKAGDAFKDAFGRTYIGDGKDGGLLGQLGEDLKRSAELSGELADRLALELGRPLRSIQDIRDALAKVDETGKDIDVRDWFGGAGGDGGGGGGGGRGLADRLSEEAKRIKAIFEDLTKTISGALSTAFTSLFDRTKKLSDVVGDMLATILNKIVEIMLQPVWNSIAQGLAGALMGSLKIGTPAITGSATTGKMTTGKTPVARMGYMSGDETGKVSAAPVTVNIHENARDDKTEVRQTSPGRIDVFLRKMVSDVIQDGGADRALAQRFAMRVQPGGR